MRRLVKVAGMWRAGASGEGVGRASPAPHRPVVLVALFLFVVLASCSAAPATGTSSVEVLGSWTGSGAGLFQAVLRPGAVAAFTQRGADLPEVEACGHVSDEVM